MAYVTNRFQKVNGGRDFCLEIGIHMCIDAICFVISFQALEGTMARQKQIAVVGAGVSGVVAVKSCVEAGMVPTCYELTADIGGVWNVDDPSGMKRVSATKTTMFNTSKEMSCFSDFPMPKQYPNYGNYQTYTQYLKDYIDHFDLKSYFVFRTSVIKVEKHPDFPNSGRWVVHVRNLTSGEEYQKTFDGVILATGAQNSPSYPSFSGVEGFRGEQIHSGCYTDAEAFKGKTVLVVGVGNFGADIAVEASRLAKQVRLKHALTNGSTAFIWPETVNQ